MNSAFSIWTPPCGPDAYSTGSSEPQHRTLFRSRRRLVRRLENRLSCHHGTLLRTRLSLRLHGLPPAGPVRFADEQGGTAFDQLRDIRESHDRFITCLKKLKRSLKNRRVRHFRRGAPRSAPPLRRSGRPACPGGIPPCPPERHRRMQDIRDIHIPAPAFQHLFSAPFLVFFRIRVNLKKNSVS